MTWTWLAGVLMGVAIVGCGDQTVVSVQRDAGSPAARTTPARTALYSDSEISFRHPSTWQAANYNSMSSFTRSIVDLSNQGMHPRCTTSADATGTTESCGWPLERLGASSALVSWEADGWPGWSMTRAPGTDIRVDGRDARWSVATPGDCKQLGATETVTVYVARVPEDNYYLMRACLTGPHTDVAEQQIREMIDTTKFNQP